MSLYLCIFTEDGEHEIAGWQLGTYSAFGCLRDTIVRHLPAEHFPVLLTHSDCEGEWSVAELRALLSELETIAARFKLFPPEEPGEPFGHTAEYRRGATSLYDCFHNVDGENLFEALIRLCKAGIQARRPISFQ